MPYDYEEETGRIKEVICEGCRVGCCFADGNPESEACPWHKKFSDAEDLVIKLEKVLA